MQALGGSLAGENLLLVSHRRLDYVFAHHWPQLLTFLRQRASATASIFD